MLNSIVNSHRHGSPHDRGGADAYYGRPARPHYHPNGSLGAESVVEADMSEEQVAAYMRGYNDNVVVNKTFNPGVGS